MNNMPIGFLDSGIGGSTVLFHALKLMKNENYFFFSDSSNCPYGDKSDEEIIERCDQIVSRMLDEKHCKAVVLACNTASAKAVDFLREKYTGLPIVAIEPAYKMVHDQSFDGFTLVMATRGTIESERFHRLYSKYDNGNTELISCVGMADLIEQSKFDELDVYLKNILGEYKGKAENVVLGCTHYPLAKENIKKVLGDVKFFDGAPGVARQLYRVLEKNNLLTDRKSEGKIEFVDSSKTECEREQKEKRFFEILSSYRCE